MYEEKEGRLIRVRRHLQDNKKVYLAAGGGLIVGAVSVFVATGGHVTIVDAFKGVHIQYKSPNINVVLERQACPEPIPVRWKKTGETFCSIRRAAAVLGKTPNEISKDLHGLAEEFERLPDSVFA